jgi:zinc transporter ZupT
MYLVAGLNYSKSYDRNPESKDLRHKVFEEIFEETRPSDGEKELLLKKQENSTYKKYFLTFLNLFVSIFPSIFEGLVLGLIIETKDFIFFLIAIFLHKGVEATIMGISFYENNVEKEITFISIMIYSLITPLGMILGMILVGISNLLEAIFLSVTAGTFLYISCTDLVKEEFLFKKNKKREFFGFVSGFLLVLLFSLIEETN